MKLRSKKLERLVSKALTTVCEQAKLDIEGFEWVTHTANYDDFPASLHIICVFSTRATQQQALSSAYLTNLISDIDKHLLEFGISLKHPSKHISFDSEEAGAKQRLL
jgi:hypothetical protein